MCLDLRRISSLKTMVVAGSLPLAYNCTPDASSMPQAADWRLLVCSPPLVTKQSAGRLLSRPGQSADWPARGRLRQQSPGLDGGRTEDYPLVTRGNTLYKSGARSPSGGVLGVSPNKWNFAVKIPYLLGQRHLRFRCLLWKNSAP